MKLGNLTTHGQQRLRSSRSTSYIVPMSASLSIRLAHVSRPSVTILHSAVCIEFDEPAVTQVFPVHTAGLSHFEAYNLAHKCTNA